MADSAESVPLPPVEARLSLHAISVVLGSVAGSAEPDAATGADGAEPSAVGTDQCCQHAAVHSARYAAALAEAAASDAAAASAASAAFSAEAAPAAAAESAAPAASSSESSPLALPSPPRAFPDIALALRERAEMAAAAEAKRAAAAASAAAAAASNGSDPDRPLSVKEQQKLLNKERQKGDPRKRAPKCNSEGTRRNCERFSMRRAMTPTARV